MVRLDRTPGAVQEESGRASFNPTRTIIEMDPPGHRPLRRLANPHFTPRKPARLDALSGRSARASLSLRGGSSCAFGPS